MEIIRNFINISGLADVDELPGNIRGPQIQYSETDIIYIPKKQPDIKSIFQIMVNVEIRTTRSILTPVGNTVVVDGIKKLKIIYTQGDSSCKANFLDLELPYNTFIELPHHVELKTISIYVLDAYFSLLDERRIYSHFVFMVNVSVGSLESDNAKNTTLNSPNKQKLNTSPQVLFIDNNAENGLTEKQTVKEVPEVNIDEEEILIDLDAEYL